MRITEDHLMRGYGLREVRTEPCACGGLISADPVDGADWGAAISAHQTSERHQRWRAWQESPQGGCTPTAGPSPVDLSSAPPVRSVPALRCGDNALAANSGTPEDRRVTTNSSGVPS